MNTGRDALPILSAITGCLKKRLVNEESAETIVKNLKYAKSLLKLLNVSRAVDYKSWWNVGVILFNVGHGCEEAFNLWKKWSATADNYCEDSCFQQWNQMEQRNHDFSNTQNLGSLRWYAKQDNEIKYKELVESCITVDKNNPAESIAALKIMTTDSPIAQMLYDMYSGEYIFSDGGWYKFNGTVWENLKNSSEEFRRQMVYISGKYQKIADLIFKLNFPESESTSRDSGHSDDDEEEELPVLSKRIKSAITSKKQQIGKAVNKLENFNSQSSIMKMAEVFFYNKDFSDQLDENPMLIAFKKWCIRFGDFKVSKGPSV